MRHSAPLLEVENLQIGGAGFVVVDKVSFTIGQGDSFGIAGESGSGKSTLLLSLMGMMRPGLQAIGGSVRLNGSAILGQCDADLTSVRGGKIALIPQNAATALNPSRRIGAQIDEVLLLHSALNKRARSERVLDLLGRVRLPEPAVTARRFPHELSGGQVQRAAIAMALAGAPKVLLLDEPTTGLDVTTQAALLDLLVDLRHRSKVAMVCVSHDLGVLARLCDRIGVMYAGAIVEEGPLVSVLAGPGHPYTQALVASIARLTSIGPPSPIVGNPPSLFHLPFGCRFASRCVFGAGRLRRPAPRTAASRRGSQDCLSAPQYALPPCGLQPCVLPPQHGICQALAPPFRSRAVSGLRQAVHVRPSCAKVCGRGHKFHRGQGGSAWAGRRIWLRQVYHFARDCWVS